MINANECMQLILAEFPEFGPAYKEHLDSWSLEGEPGLLLDVAEFSHYIADVLKDLSDEDRRRIFGLAERLMLEGDEEVQNAAATCFLENLAHRVEGGILPTSSFGPYLGKESREYIRGYDEMMGSKTPGLWDEDVSSTDDDID
jgi:hypothetical protein